MISPDDPDAVFSGLGDKFLSAFAGSVSGARTDLAEMRAWRPDWFPTMHSRCLANLIHDRIWSRFAAAVDGDTGVTLIEHGATREVQIGANFRLRVKRHRPADRLSMYRTQTALAFYIQQEIMIPGLELITLAAGYRWDHDLREILAPVISYRDGVDNLIWAMELTEPEAAGATPITWTPIDIPDLPEIDLGDEDAEGGADSGDDG